MVVFQANPAGGSGRAPFAADASGANRQALNAPFAFQQPPGGNPYLQISADGSTTTVLDATENGTNQVFRIESDVRIQDQLTFGFNVDGYALSAAGRTLAVINLGLGRIDLVRLANGSRETAVTGGALRIGNFSRTGRLAFVARNTGGSGQRIGILDAATKSTTYLSTPSAAIEDISISPNASLVAFVSSGDLYLQSSSAPNAVRLTTTPEIEHMPAFSRDGQTLVFGRDPNTANSALYAMSVGGGAATRLSADFGVDEEACFVDMVPDALKIVP